MLRCVIHHNKMHNSSIIQRKQHVPSSIHMFIKIHKTIDSIAEITRSRLLIFFMKSLPCNQLCRYNVPPNHRPACSSISQQHCHPRAGHDSSKDKGQCRLTHSQGTPSANQHSWVYQALNKLAKPAQSKDQPLHTRNKTTLHIPVKKQRRPEIIPSKR